METFKDPDFLNDAKRAGLDIDPITAEGVAKSVDALLSMSPELASKLMKIITGKATR